MNMFYSKPFIIYYTVLSYYSTLVNGSTQRIVGGENAPINEYPWFAGSEKCGGSLVSPEFVLTAAHCYSAISSFEIGDFCRNNLDVNGDNCGQQSKLLAVKQRFMHPKYNYSTLNNDFALMKLQQRVPDNFSFVPMDMCSLSSTYEPGHKLWSLGFGTTSFGGTTSNALKHVELSFVPNDVCHDQYIPIGYRIFDSMMCASDPGEDACQGDSGGPLYDKTNNVLIGVVSWGEGCADSRYPGVYSRISDQWEWIRTTICDNHSNPKPDYCNESASLCENDAPIPSEAPSDMPSKRPSTQPSLRPSIIPSSTPSHNPSNVPSSLPSTIPSKKPSLEPSSYPSNETSSVPSLYPTIDPTTLPTYQPSILADSSKSIVNQVPNGTTNSSNISTNLISNNIFILFSGVLWALYLLH